MAKSIHHITVPSATRSLDDVRKFVAIHAQGAQFSEREIGHFKLAVDEACTNVIKHAYGADENREIDVAVIIDANRFTVRIRDRGATFDRAEYEEPDLATLVRERKRGGLGVELMRRLMDEVSYETRGAVNEVQLTKYRNGR